MDRSWEKVNVSRAERIIGFMPVRQLRCLFQLAKGRSRILEVGSYQGRSTRALVDGSPADCRVEVVDPWYPEYLKDKEGREIHSAPCSNEEAFSLNLADAISTGKLRKHPVEFRHAKLEGTFDLIFLDGLHDKNNVEHDIEKALSLIAPGGTLAGHDWREQAWPEVTEVVRHYWPEHHIRAVDNIWIVEDPLNKLRGDA